jgi:hypothetical protein
MSYYLLGVVWPATAHDAASPAMTPKHFFLCVSSTWGMCFSLEANLIG